MLSFTQIRYYRPLGFSIRWNSCNVDVVANQWNAWAATTTSTLSLGNGMELAVDCIALIPIRWNKVRRLKVRPISIRERETNKQSTWKNFLQFCDHEFNGFHCIQSAARWHLKRKCQQRVEMNMKGWKFFWPSKRVSFPVPAPTSTTTDCEVIPHKVTKYWIDSGG